MVVFSLTRWSSLIPTGFLVSRRTLDTHGSWIVSCTGLLPCIEQLSNCLPLQFSFPSWVLHPEHITIFGLGSSDFARHYFRNRYYFLFLRVIRCFSSPGSPYYTIDSCNNNITLLMLSSLIRKSTDHGIFASPRSLSQLVTSFFGAMYQGIHLYALRSLIFRCFRIRRIDLILNFVFTRLISEVNCFLRFIRINLSFSLISSLSNLPCTLILKYFL